MQISQKEMMLYGTTPAEFSKEYYLQHNALGITVPTTLHLDHTVDMDIIIKAIDAGFESVMIDASSRALSENIDITSQVVSYAHSKGVSVEAELGRIGGADQIETDEDKELFTDPGEAELFVRRTGVDALAVSVGTAHGVYTARQPIIDYDIIRQIKELTPVYLVLHGGSGVPAEMVIQSYKMEGGGISKINIATDLELALLETVGQRERMNNAWCNELSKKLLDLGREAVYSLTCDRIENYLHAKGKAWS